MVLASGQWSLSSLAVPTSSPSPSPILDSCGHRVWGKYRPFQQEDSDDTHLRYVFELWNPDDGLAFLDHQEIGARIQKSSGKVKTPQAKGEVLSKVRQKTTTQNSMIKLTEKKKAVHT